MPETTVLEQQRFEDLVSQLASKGNLTRERIDELIQEKKSKIGGGYLTDQGALFLIASQMGIDVNYDPTRTRSISDITLDSSSLTLTSRLLAIGLRVFNRKKDSGKGLLLRTTVYDDTGAISINLWDAAAVSFLEESGFEPDDTVKITNAYPRQGLDGTIILNLGDNGKIERVSDNQTINRTNKRIREMALIPSMLPKEGKMMSVRGKVDGDVKKSTYVRSDGSTSQYCSFVLGDEKGGQARAVVWNNLNPVFDSIKRNDDITLLNVKSKHHNFQNSSAVEVHGDEATCILERWEETRNWMIEQVRNLGSFGERSSQSTSLTSAASQTLFPFVARVISIRRLDERCHVLLVDSQSRKITATVLGKASSSPLDLQVDDLVVCRPKTFELNTLKATIEANSITKSNSKRPDIPNSDSLGARVEDLEPGQIVCLELMCMSESISREIQTRDGSIRRSEILVGDHTGDIKLYGWRELSRLVENFSVGDRIKLRGVEVQNHEGKKFLNLKSYSSLSLHS